MTGEPPESAAARAARAVAAAVPQARRDHLRPGYHFRPPAQWMNDPNGTIYRDGWYHVFYQHNPYGDDWGTVHWGHTRSRDIVHWEHLPIALCPSEELGEAHCFSGCLTAAAGGVPMVLYTSIPHEGREAAAEQWAALGDSELMTWQKHAANPILTQQAHGDLSVGDWRDPFVFGEAGRVFMVLGGKLPEERGGEAVVLLYEAANDALTCWQYRGVLFRHPVRELGSIECPNFLRLGDRFVLIVSPYGPVECFAGDFDIDRGAFTPDADGRIDHSDNFYATNVLFDEGGRCVLFGWVRGFPGSRGWNGCLSLPRILSTGPDGRLRQEPAPELQRLRDRAWRVGPLAVEDPQVPLPEAAGDMLEVQATLALGNARAVGLRLRRIDSGEMCAGATYDSTNLAVSGHHVPVDGGERTSLHLFLDRSVLEVFADGRECVTRIVDPGKAGVKVEVFAEGGSARVETLEVWTLQSVW